MTRCRQAFIALFLTAVVLILTEPPLGSEPGAVPYTVLSEFFSTDGTQSSRFRRWLVTIDDKQPSGRTITFSSPRSTSNAPLCTVTVRPDGAIDWHGALRGRTKRTSNGLMVLPGHPIPGDILPARRSGETVTFDDRVTAGDRVFIKQYSCSYAMVTRDEAVDAGWIKESAALSLSKLEMRTVLDDNGDLVVRQLWPQSSSWWVYEETPFRRSWVVFE